MTQRSASVALWFSAVALTAIGLWLIGGPAIEAWYFVFIVASGFAVGSLGLLTIGHLMGEDWLAPIRSEAEAAALTMPLLLLLAVPLALSLGALYPWASSGPLNQPSPRAVYLTPAFFLARAGLYLVVWTGLAAWITRTRRPRVAGAVGLTALAPTATFAAGDWILMREPLWWSSLFGFSFALSQLLAALAGAILISLLRPEHPNPRRMQSLERALLTLALLTIWTWFAQFLIVWLGNLPNEASWYLSRWGGWQWLLYAAVLPLVLAILLMAPPGFSRRTMIAGSALVLVHHAAHMAWLVMPSARQGPAAWSDVLVAAGAGGLWGAWFFVGLRARPMFEEQGQEQELAQTQSKSERRLAEDDEMVSPSGRPSIR